MSDEKPEAEPAGAPASPAPEKAGEAGSAPADETAPGADTGEPSASDGAEPAGDPSGEPSGKRKKRKRKRAEEVVLRPSLRPDGRERPAFLLAFPSDPELERLIRAFELGNYALVRKDAPSLAARTTDAKVRAAAEELARRIEPDPLVKVLLGLSIALLVVLTLWAYKTHGG
jgi:hypothetical protein